MIYPSFGAEERRGNGAEVNSFPIRIYVPRSQCRGEREARKADRSSPILVRVEGLFSLEQLDITTTRPLSFFFFPPRDTNESRGKGEGGGIFPGLRRSKSKDSRRVNSRESGILEKVERERVFISTLPFSIFLTFSRSKIKTR